MKWRILKTVARIRERIYWKVKIDRSRSNRDYKKIFVKRNVEPNIFTHELIMKKLIKIMWERSFMWRHMRTNHQAKVWLYWGERSDLSKRSTKTKIIRSEIHYINQNMMKEHQCIKQRCYIKCELWHEIFLFFSKQEDAIISDKLKEILI